ncbi:MAG: hypothetical protein EXR21_04620 [Flavobacteriaceae bacterium]|nr:hypothetical protein [Flavobacteriaceae bacterium]
MAVLFPSIIYAQTIQGDLPDSVIKKLECKKLWSIIDGSREKFKKIKGARKPYKYSEVYAVKILPNGVKQAEIVMEGRVCKYAATLVNSNNRKEAAQAYTKFLPQIEICLEGWIFETELEDENQIYRFKAYEKEDMQTGVTVELLFRKGKKKFIVELVIQP